MTQTKCLLRFHPLRYTAAESKNLRRDMMRKFLILGVAALAISACSDKGADADGDGKISDAEATAEMGSGGKMAMKPGEWEVKISFDKIDAPGIPANLQGKMKEQMGQGMTQKSCLTQEQVDKPGGDFFGAPAEANCTFDELSRSGNGMKVAMTCKPAGNMTVKSKMDGQFAAETYTMTIEQATEGTPMGAVKMTGKIEGKRVGDCPA
jgi:Protein of unknown function (DUF3617)